MKTGSTTTPQRRIEGVVDRNLDGDAALLSIGRRDGVSGRDRFVVYRGNQPIGRAVVENLWEGGCLVLPLGVRGDLLIAPGDVVRLEDSALGIIFREPLIDCTFDEAPLADAMAEIGRLVGKQIVVEPEQAWKRVTISLRQIPWHDAIDIISKMAIVEVVRDSRGIVITDVCSPSPSSVEGHWFRDAR